MRNLSFVLKFVSFSVYLILATSFSWIDYPTTNLMNGCGMVCQNNGPYLCLGTFTSFAECQYSCQQNSRCSTAGLVTWSSGTGNCWTRTDNVWDSETDATADSGCLQGVNPHCFPPPPPYNGTNITFTVNTLSPVMTTHPLSPAVTLDFWRHDDPTFGIKWGNSSAISIDLTNPLLRNLTSLLGPGLLRLGGSPEDSLVYDNDGTCIPGSGGNGPAPGYYCSQVHPYTYDCLTPSRWQQLLHFAESTGMQIAMGLNGCYGRLSSNTSMDFSNVQALLKDTINSPYINGFWGLELSNEVVPNTISPYIWGQDATTIHTMAQQLFGYKVPIVGPDQGGSSPIADIAKSTSPGTLAAFTYHQYPECTAPSNTPFVLAVSCLINIDTNAQACVTASQSNGPNPAGIWAGETADHSGGGIFNLTDTFRSSFYYAYQLGALPVNGVELGARQTLSGGAYSLLQVSNFQPNPDYFVLYLYRALIGGSAKAYDVTASLYFNYTGVRVFAFSANPTRTNGARYTLLAINLRTDTGFALTIEGNDFTPSSTRTEYHLTGDITAENGTIYCNGTPLVVNPQTNLPPSVSSLGKTTNGGLMIGPMSIVFATVQ